MSVYWLFFALTWAVAAGCFAWRARREGVAAGAIVDAILLVIPLLLAGAHLVSMVMGRGEVMPWRQFLLTLDGWRSGYASYGAIAGTLLGLAGAARLHRYSPLLFLDVAVVPGLFLASVVGRSGCFLTPCCFGAPADVPWAMRFEIGTPPWRVTTLPSHPTQLYEIGLSLAAFLFFVAWRPAVERRLRTRSGEGLLAVLGLGLFLSERFVIEFFRVGGTSEPILHGISKTHLVTGAGVLVCALLLARHRARTGRASQAA